MFSQGRRFALSRRRSILSAPHAKAFAASLSGRTAWLEHRAAAAELDRRAAFRRGIAEP
jgi:hypothetical protein